jgi:ABC-type uncharacterized transport system substrate-binding protein
MDRVSRRAAIPTEAQIRRAIKAAKKAGLEVGAVEIDNSTGGIKVVPKYDNEPDVTTTDLDNWIAKHARSIERH